MVLTYAKDITRAYGGNVVRDCVITVPMSATQIEREALLAAAELADLRVLSLIEANTAAALQFGLDRKFDEPRKVLHAFIERDGFTAPAGWPGYRPLTEK